MKMGKWRKLHLYFYSVYIKWENGNFWLIHCDTVENKTWSSWRQKTRKKIKFKEKKLYVFDLAIKRFLLFLAVWVMGSFKGHALPGSFFLVAGLWWTGKHSLWHVTRRNKNMGSSRLASRVLQRRLEMIESSVVVFFSLVGRLNLHKDRFLSA